LYLIGLAGSRVLSTARSCQCLLWTGLSEQVQSTHRLLFSAKGKFFVVLKILMLKSMIKELETFPH